MDAKFRHLKVADTPDIAALLERARAAPGGSWGLDWKLDHVREECTRGEGWASLTTSGEIIAFVFLRDVADAQEILLLATAPEFRRQGRMSALLHHVNEVGHAPLWLEVHAANQGARAFYEKLGFRRVGERPGYYSDGGAAVLYNFG